MFKITKFEVKKIFNGKAFGILSLILILLTIFTFIALRHSKISGNELLFNTFASSGIEIILAIIIPIVMCSDFENKAFRLIIGRGFTKNKYLSGKVLTITILTIGLSLISLFTAAILYLKSGKTEKITNLYIDKIALILLVQLGFASVYMVISLVVKKKGGAIALNILLPMMISLLLPLLDKLLKNGMKKSISGYWISSIPQKIADMGTLDQNTIAIFVVLIIYCIIGFLLNNILIRRTEI